MLPVEFRTCDVGVNDGLFESESLSVLEELGLGEVVPTKDCFSVGVWGGDTEGVIVDVVDGDDV
jgi:hypothetical protein